MNPERIPHWVGRPIDWWHANTPVASMVESDRRIEAGEPPEGVALTVAHLRSGVLVLAWDAPPIWPYPLPVIGVLDGPYGSGGYRWCIRLAAIHADERGFADNELAVLP